jgi:hypothetical protein
MYSLQKILDQLTFSEGSMVIFISNFILDTIIFLMPILFAIMIFMLVINITKKGTSQIKSEIIILTGIITLFMLINSTRYTDYTGVEKYKVIDWASNIFKSGEMIANSITYKILFNDSEVNDKNDKKDKLDFLLKNKLKEYHEKNFNNIELKELKNNNQFKKSFQKNYNEIAEEYLKIYDELYKIQNCYNYSVNALGTQLTGCNSTKKIINKEATLKNLNNFFKKYKTKTNLGFLNEDGVNFLSDYEEAKNNIYNSYKKIFDIAKNKIHEKTYISNKYINRIIKGNITTDTINARKNFINIDETAISKLTFGYWTENDIFLVDTEKKINDIFTKFTDLKTSNICKRITIKDQKKCYENNIEKIDGTFEERFAIRYSEDNMPQIIKIKQDLINILFQLNIKIARLLKKHGVEKESITQTTNIIGLYQALLISHQSQTKEKYEFNLFKSEIETIGGELLGLEDKISSIDHSLKIKEPKKKIKLDSLNEFMKQAGLNKEPRNISWVDLGFYYPFLKAYVSEDLNMFIKLNSGVIENNIAEDGQKALTYAIDIYENEEKSEANKKSIDDINGVANTVGVIIGGVTAAKTALGEVGKKSWLMRIPFVGQVVSVYSAAKVIVKGSLAYLFWSAAFTIMLILINYVLPALLWFMAIMSWYIKSALILALSPFIFLTIIFNDKRTIVTKYIFIIFGQALVPIALVIILFIIMEFSIIVEIALSSALPFLKGILSINTGIDILSGAESLLNGLTDEIIYWIYKLLMVFINTMLYFQFFKANEYIGETIGESIKGDVFSGESLLNKTKVGSAI